MNKLFLFSVLSAMTLQLAFAAAPASVPDTSSTGAVSTSPSSSDTAGSTSASDSASGSNSSTGVATTSPSSSDTAGSTSTNTSNTADNASSSNSGSSGSSPSVPAVTFHFYAISMDDFTTAWTNGKKYLPNTNMSRPTKEQFSGFMKYSSEFSSGDELAMFFAQIMWESGGFANKSEAACRDHKCAGKYVDSVGLPGKKYYGRGYLNMRYGANYKEASMTLFKDDRLLQNPELVATNDDYAWDVTYWYWKNKVRPVLNGSKKFGLTTKAISGETECSGSNIDISKKRFQIYMGALSAFHFYSSSKPNESGCYN